MSAYPWPQPGPGQAAGMYGFTAQNPTQGGAQYGMHPARPHPMAAASYNAMRMGMQMMPQPFPMSPHPQGMLIPGGGGMYGLPQPAMTPGVVAPPSNQRLRHLCETMAAYCAKNPALEDATRERNRTNPEFAFLFGGQGYDYYQWCQHMIRSGLPIAGNEQQMAAGTFQRPMYQAGPSAQVGFNGMQAVSSTDSAVVMEGSLGPQAAGYDTQPPRTAAEEAAGSLHQESHQSSSYNNYPTQTPPYPPEGVENQMAYMAQDAGHAASPPGKPPLDGQQIEYDLESLLLRFPRPMVSPDVIRQWPQYEELRQVVLSLSSPPENTEEALRRAQIWIECQDQFEISQILDGLVLILVTADAPPPVPMLKNLMTVLAKCMQHEVSKNAKDSGKANSSSTLVAQMQNALPWFLRIIHAAADNDEAVTQGVLKQFMQLDLVQDLEAKDEILFLATTPSLPPLRLLFLQQPVMSGMGPPGRPPPMAPAAGMVPRPPAPESAPIFAGGPPPGGGPPVPAGPPVAVPRSRMGSRAPSIPYPSSTGDPYISRPPPLANGGAVSSPYYAPSGGGHSPLTPETIPVGLLATMLKQMRLKSKSMQVAFVPYRPLDPMQTPQQLPPMEHPTDFTLNRMEQLQSELLAAEDDVIHELEKEGNHGRRKRRNAEDEDDSTTNGAPNVDVGGIIERRHKDNMLQEGPEAGTKRMYADDLADHSDEKRFRSECRSPTFLRRGDDSGGDVGDYDRRRRPRPPPGPPPTEASRMYYEQEEAEPVHPVQWAQAEMGVDKDGSAFKGHGGGVRAGLGSGGSASDLFEDFRARRSTAYHTMIANAYADRDRGVNRDVQLCYVCNQPGHKARDCKNPS